MVLDRSLTFGVAFVVGYLRRERTNHSSRSLSLAIGRSESYVGKLEAGTIEPTLRSFALLARELRMSPAEVYVTVMHEASAAAEDVTPHPYDRVSA